MREQSRTDGSMCLADTGYGEIKRVLSRVYRHVQPTANVFILRRFVRRTMSVACDVRLAEPSKPLTASTLQGGRHR